MLFIWKMSTLFFVSRRKCHHPFPSPIADSPPPHTQLWTCFQFPLCVDRHTHLGDLAFFLCFQVWRRLGMEWEVKGWPCAGCCLGLCQHNLCSVIPFPLDHAKRGRGKQTRQSISCSVVSWHTAEWTVYIMPYIPDLYHIVGFSRRIFE